MNMLLTASTSNIDQELSQAVSDFMGGIMALMAISWVFGILVLIATVALITWVVRAVWYSGERRRYRRQQREWARAERQWNRQRRRTETEFEEFMRTGTTKRADFQQYPTGWTFNKKTQLWEPPKSLSKQSKQRWSWDEEKRIWKEK